MTVRSETRGRTAVIHVERPEKRNAIDSALTRALDEALNRFQLMWPERMPALERN